MLYVSIEEQQIKPPYLLSPSTINESGRTHLTPGRAAIKNTSHSYSICHKTRKNPKKEDEILKDKCQYTSYLVSQRFLNPAAKCIVVLCGHRI